MPKKKDDLNPKVGLRILERILRRDDLIAVLADEGPVIGWDVRGKGRDAELVIRCWNHDKGITEVIVDQADARNSHVVHRYGDPVPCIFLYGRDKDGCLFTGYLYFQAPCDARELVREAKEKRK